MLCAIAVVAASLIVGSPEPAPIATAGEEAQIVMLGLKGAQYTPEIINVEVGEPVTLKNDGTLAGCGLYIVQRDLGIYANFARQNEYTFTPVKKGTFTYTCSMGMYAGTMKVT